jgi:acyl-CoA reductase-like NAD-dependent aldehyde dehydrogenase
MNNIYRMIGIGLETGGKNPAYVRDDVDIDIILPEIIKGTFHNSG